MRKTRNRQKTKQNKKRILIQCHFFETELCECLVNERLSPYIMGHRQVIQYTLSDQTHRSCLCCSCCSSALFSWLQVVGSDLTLFTNKSYLCLCPTVYLFHQDIYMSINVFKCIYFMLIKFKGGTFWNVLQWHM